MSLGNWKVYAAAAVLAVAGFVYGCNKRLDISHSYQISDVKRESECEKELSYKVTLEADRIISGGIERMVEAGANLNARKVYTLLSCTDVDGDGMIDEFEARLAEPWLNPDSICGRAAFPYDGPDYLPEKPAESLQQMFGRPSSGPWRWTPYIMVLIDENEDNLITKDEALRMMYKMRKK